jgi:hypothetical protein
MRNPTPLRRANVELLESRRMLCATAADHGTLDSAIAADLPFGPVGPELHVSDDTGGTGVAVGTDAAGNSVVAWQRLGEEGVGSDVYARRYDPAGQPLGDEFLVNTTTDGGQWEPAVAMAADGQFVVGWTGVDEYGYGVYAQRYDASGTPHGEEFRVNSATDNYQLHPSVAADDDGGFVFAWVASRPPQTPGGCVGCHDGPDYPPEPTPVDGEPVLNGVYVRRFGGDGEPVSVESYVSAGGDPAVAMSAEGDFVVAWERQAPPLAPTGSVAIPWWMWRYGPPPEDDDPSGLGIYARHYAAAGEPLGEEFLVNTTTDGDQRTPAVAMNADGDVVVVWSGYGRSELGFPEYGVYARQFDAAGPLGDEFDVAVTSIGGGTASTPSLPSVAVDADGNFAVAWNRESFIIDPITTMPIYFYDAAVRRYGAAGEPLEDAFRLQGTLPSLAMNGVGNFVVAWRGAGGPVRAQRFGPLPPRVTGVFVSGSDWTPAFRNFLQSQGLGDATFGYTVPAGEGQFDEMPWGNIDQISIRFSQDVVTAQWHLGIEDLNGVDFSTSFDYDPSTHTASWTLSQPLRSGRFLLRLDASEPVACLDLWPCSSNRSDGVADPFGRGLDGEWANGNDMFPSGDGIPGGDFLFALNVLPGDVNRDGRVTAVDVAQVRARAFTSTRLPSLRGSAYTPFHDTNGSGTINSLDMVHVRSRILTALPVPSSGSTNGTGLPWWLYGGGAGYGPFLDPPLVGYGQEWWLYRD